MKNIVVLDGFTLGNVGFENLEKFGKVTFYERTKPEELLERIKNAHIILTNKVVLKGDDLRECNNLELICEMATGFNNIDIEYAKENKIAVTNVAGYSTATVAQHTFATLLHLYDKISYYDEYVKSGRYSKSGDFTHIDKPYNDLDGKVWGIVGLGAIGKRVGNIAKAFGCRVIYLSTSGKNNSSDFERVELDKLLLESDVISIHAPLNNNTNELFNYENICKMKSSAILVNMGRGPIVVDEDLARAIEEEKIAGAALDVFTLEPILESNPLLHVKNKDRLVLSPHIAWASEEARGRLFGMIIKNIEAFYRGEELNRIDK